MNGEERKKSPGNLPPGEDSSGEFSVGPSLVAAMLEGRLLEETSLNAATGYQIDPRMPAPEVFERPEWGITMVEPGMPSVEVAEYDSVDALAKLTAGADEGIPDQQAALETSVVEPVVWARLQVRGWARGWRYGLGYHVGARQLFLFSTPGAP